MKIKQKGVLTFGRLIAAAYPAWWAGKPVRIEAKACPMTLRAFDFFHERLARLNTLNVQANRIKIGLAIVMLTALTGCIGVVDGGGYGDGYYGDGVYVGGWWGGGHDRGRDVHGYSARGSASRGAAHRGGGHAGVGGGGRR